jgi:glycerate dehydrogenase
MRAVFLDKQTFHTNIDLSPIQQKVTDLISYDVTLDEQVIARSEQADIIITNKVLLNAERLAQLPNLKLICIAATGTNNVDLKAAKKVGVSVCNVSGYSTPCVSQYVFAQILEYYNQTSHHNQNTEQERWQNSPVFCHLGNGFNELDGQKLGIIGYGNLGQEVAKIGAAFGMEILIAERPNTQNIRTGRVSFECTLEQADILTLHCPQTPDTENLINSNTLAKMKPNAMLINTSRGPVVNSQDLLRALQKKVIAYAALDVLEQEPPAKDHPLLLAISDPTSPMTNLKITAHIAWASYQAQDRLINLIGDNIVAFSQGKRLNRVEG